MSEIVCVINSATTVEVSASDSSRYFLLQSRAAGSLAKGHFDQAVRCRLPVQPNTACGVNPRALWLTPSSWAIVATKESVDFDSLDLAKTHSLCKLTDLSDSITIFRFVGPEARAILCRGCSLDLHPKVWLHGRCGQSLLAGVPMLIDRISDEHSFTVYVDCSVRSYLTNWVQAVAARMQRGNGER